MQLYNKKGLLTLQSEDRIQGSYPSQLCSAWQAHSEWLHAQWMFEDIQTETQAAWEFDILMHFDNKGPTRTREESLKMKTDVGMAYQKVHKQGRI